MSLLLRRSDPFTSIMSIRIEIVSIIDNTLSGHRIRMLFHDPWLLLLLRLWLLLLLMLILPLHLHRLLQPRIRIIIHTASTALLNNPLHPLTPPRHHSRPIHVVPIRPCSARRPRRDIRRYISTATAAITRTTTTTTYTTHQHRRRGHRYRRRWRCRRDDRVP